MVEEKLFVCESCGQTTPIDNEECSNCGGKMVVFNDNVEPKPENLKDEDLDSNTGMDNPTDVGVQSLEDLADKEQEESDEEYKHNSYDNSDE